MYIVCWVKQSTKQTTDISPKNKDKYQVFTDSTSKENKKQAEEFYNKVLNKDSTYSANLCKIIKSSDY